MRRVLLAAAMVVGLSAQADAGQLLSALKRGTTVKVCGVNDLGKSFCETYRPGGILVSGDGRRGRWGLEEGTDRICRWGIRPGQRCSAEGNFSGLQISYGG